MSLFCLFFVLFSCDGRIFSHFLYGIRFPASPRTPTCLESAHTRLIIIIGSNLLYCALLYLQGPFVVCITVLYAVH